MNLVPGEANGNEPIDCCINWLRSGGKEHTLFTSLGTKTLSFSGLTRESIFL